jgi:hypothetical protein
MDRIEEMSPTSPVPILSATSYDYQLVMKCHDNELEMWYTPQEWFGDNTLPIAQQTLPKEWVTFPGFEIFVAPTYEKHLGANIVSHIFWATIDDTRVPNPENPEGFITIANIQEDPMPQITRSLDIWEGPRQLQKQFNRRLAGISSMIEPIQAKFPEFLGEFSCDELLISTVGLSPADSGCFNPWAVVLAPGDRKAVFTGKESSALTKIQTAICAFHTANK